MARKIDLAAHREEIERKGVGDSMLLLQTLEEIKTICEEADSCQDAFMSIGEMLGVDFRTK